MGFDGSGGVSYYLEDAMDSVIGLTSGSGALTAAYAYDGFGNARSGSTPANPAAGGEFGFHGAWREDATGLYHMRARDYDPVTGRFVSRDPVEPAETAPETYNPYVFADSNPHLYTDPTGGFSVAEINIGAAIQNGLQNWRAVAANYVRRQAVSMARELTVDTIQQVLGRTLPIGGLIRDVERMTYAFQQGNALGGWVRNNICNLLGNPGDIWFEVPLRVDGTPVGNGFTCDERGNQRFPGGRPIAGTKRPDVIFGPHAPLEQAAGTAGDNWLVTEVKIKLTTAISDVKHNPKQLDAMVNYIKRYTPVPIGSWIFLFTGARTKTMKAQLVASFERTLIGKGIAGVLAFLTEREGPHRG
jgi:RHS repeat-associated protein